MVHQRRYGILAVLLVVLLGVGLAPAKTRHATAAKKKTVQTKSTGSKAPKSAKSKSKSSHSSAKTAAVHCRKGKKCKATATARVRGQAGIDSERMREIQAALIRENYLEGEPTGAFDQRTKEALSKFQSDNGWQSKVVPDSRALIKLGLGPSHDGLLNPESAAVADPTDLGTEKEIPGGGVRVASGK